MSDTNERSVASTGSQPVAWAVEFEGEVEPFCGSFDKSEAIKVAGEVGRVFPLWRSPTLTDEEREAIDRLCRAVARHSALQRIRGLKDHFADEDAQAYSIVRGWLARLT